MPSIFEPLTSSSYGRTEVLAFAGELDLATAPQFEAYFEALDLDGRDDVVLDAARISFVDSTGLRSILRISERCRRNGCSFRVDSPSTQLRKLLELTGTGAVLLSDAGAGNL
jgi:anti-anti-sigma factor